MGTSSTRIAIRHKGIVLREPTYLGLNSRSGEYIFFGHEAKTITGKTPDFIKIVRPIVNGILYDFDASVSFLQYAIQAAVHPYLREYLLLKPPLSGVTCAPSTATEIERKALIESLQKTECGEVFLIERALATAAGCGYDVFSHEPRMVIDMGGGLIELSIVSGGGIVSQRTIKNAGDQMNKRIANYIYFKHSLVLGESTCEDLKISLLRFSGEEAQINVRGKSLETGLPKSAKIRSGEIREALESQFQHVIDAAKEMLELAPPEVADAVYRNGIALTGMLAAVQGIDEFLRNDLKIDVFRVEHFQDATILGLMKLDRNPERMYTLANMSQ